MEEHTGGQPTGLSRRLFIIRAGAIGATALAAAAGGGYLLVDHASDRSPRATAWRIAATPSGPATTRPAPAEPVPSARPAPSGLPVINYGPAPKGFPADPSPASALPPREVLHALTRVALYDAPGGRPRAFLPPYIRGVAVHVPVVARRTGWLAVMVPSANRRIGWIPGHPAETGAGAAARGVTRRRWTITPMRDHLVVQRAKHTLTWSRDGVPVRTWRVSLGMRRSPTPLGRTFVLGRSTLQGEVYGDTDVFALGAVPDDPNSVPWGLRGAHIGIHTWYHDGELGMDTTDGCIRLTKKGQRELLRELHPGTPVLVVDRLPAAAGARR